VANSTRFSTAVVCAAISRCAHGDCGIAFGPGLSRRRLQARTQDAVDRVGNPEQPGHDDLITSQNSSWVRMS